MKDIQSKVKAFSTERGYDSETLEQKFLLLIEEVGEFAKAARKEVGMQVGKHSKDSHLAEEAADVLYVLVDLANNLNVDLGTELYNKIELVKTRTYTSKS